MIEQLLIAVLLYAYIIVPGAQWLLGLSFRQTRRVFGFDVQTAASLVGAILLIPALVVSVMYRRYFLNVISTFKKRRNR